MNKATTARRGEQMYTNVRALVEMNTGTTDPHPIKGTQEVLIRELKAAGMWDPGHHCQGIFAAKIIKVEIVQDDMPKKLIGRINWAGAICMVYIATWVGMALMSVGKLPDCDPHAYDWSLPIMTLITFAVPAGLGYFWGKDRYL